MYAMMDTDIVHTYRPLHMGFVVPKIGMMSCLRSGKRRENAKNSYRGYKPGTIPGGKSPRRPLYIHSGRTHQPAGLDTRNSSH